VSELKGTGLGVGYFVEWMNTYRTVAGEEVGRQRFRIFKFDPSRNAADLPPRPQCALRWQPRFRSALPDIRLTLLVGQYAQRFYLGDSRKRTLAETVRAFREYLPEFFVLPHPSWRNKGWLKKNPWFSRIVIPELRKRVDDAFDRYNPRPA